MNQQNRKQSEGRWVQTEREAHGALLVLIDRSPLAAKVVHALIKAMTRDFNGVVLSQKNLARMVNGSERGVRDAIKLLRDENWIEVRQIGGRGTVNAYIINDRVAWSGKRDGIRYSQFSARVIVSDDEQPDATSLDQQKPLRRMPDFPTVQRTHAAE